jgi:hypothetical protein
MPTFRTALVALALVCACARKDDSSPTVAKGGAQSADERGLVILNPTSERPYFHDFGRRLYGEKVKHVFRLENTEDRLVTIRDMLPSCSCTVPRVSYTTSDGKLVKGSVVRGQEVIQLPPHVVADVEVQIDTTYVEKVNVDKLSVVRITSDSIGTPYVTLELHLIVTRAFRAVPATIDMGEAPQSVGKSARTDVSTEAKGDPSRILGVDSVEGPFTAALEESRANDETFWILIATVAPGLPLGPAQGKVWLSTSGPDGTGKGQSFSVPLRAQIVPEIVVRPPVFEMPRLERGKSARFEAALESLAPGSTVQVLAARVEGIGAEHLKLEFVPDSPDDSQRSNVWRLTLVADERFDAEAFSGTVLVQTDDPQVPIVRIPYAGTSR